MGWIQIRKESDTDKELTGMVVEGVMVIATIIFPNCKTGIFLTVDDGGFILYYMYVAQSIERGNFGLIVHLYEKINYIKIKPKFKFAIHHLIENIDE